MPGACFLCASILYTDVQSPEANEEKTKVLDGIIKYIKNFSLPLVFVLACGHY